MGYTDDFIYLIWSSLPNHENYMDQYVKTMQSDEVHYYKLNWVQTIRPQQMIFQWNILKCITVNFHLYFDQAGTLYTVCDETSHPESYKSTE